MSFDGTVVKRIFLFAFYLLFAGEAIAQKQVSPDGERLFETSRSGQAFDVDQQRLHASLPVDTLRNYTPGGTIFGYFANNEDQLGGWVHGTNFFEDLAKATKISLPDGALGATLNEVLVTFIYKSPTVTVQTYSIEIREVNPEGAPGDLLDFETFSMADIQADADFATDAVPTSHPFPLGVNVPQEFFVVVDFGSYLEADWQNVAIAASPNLGRFVDEEWELLSDDTWINMSASWFPDTMDDGWYMWIDAVINTDIAFNDPYEPNDTANEATAIQNGFVSSGAAVFPVGDVDYYVFDGVAGTTIDVFAQADVGAAAEIDGIISVYNSIGDLVASNDDLNDVSFTESQVILTLPATDTYYIRYASYDNDSGVDFPNKKDAEPLVPGELLRSGVHQYVAGVQRDAKGEREAAELHKVDDVGAYTLQFTVSGGGIDATAPVVQHAPAAVVVPVGQDIPVRAEATDSESGIESVLLTYLEGGRGADNVGISAMSLVSGNTYEGVIPAALVNDRGLQYQVAGVDAAGNIGFSNLVNLEVRLEEGLSRTVTVSGSNTNSYRIISMPINLDNNSVRAVLEDDLGAYDREVWRFWELQANQMYAEFPNVGTLSPGRAYWFATSQSGQTLTSGPGTTVSLEFLFEIPLNPGWTFVGTPFNFPIGPNQVTLESGVAPDIRAFNGSWGTASGALMPFQGYAVASVSNDRLIVNPFLSETSKQGVAAPSKAGPTEYEWAVSISASSGAVIDDDNMIAISSLASGGWDAMDRPEPPVIGDYISLYFPHADWDVPFSQFNMDVRPAFEESQQWVFEVSTNQEGPVEITFGGIESLPRELSVHLVDRQMHYTQDLRKSATYTILGREQDIKERFTIVVGASGAVSEELDKLATIPESMTLHTYPNPFQSYTTLEFGLPEAADVTVDVYDLLGKRVATLVQGESMDAGTHALQWEGTDASGRPLANGIYVFAIQTGGSSAAQKVVLLR